SGGVGREAFGGPAVRGRAGGGGEHVAAAGGDRGEGRTAARHVPGDRRSRVATQRAGNRRALVEQAAGPANLELDERADLGRRRGRGQVGLGDTVPGEVVGGQVGTASPEIFGH